MRKKYVVMFVRVIEDDDGLNMSNPFFGGKVNNDEEMQRLITEIKSDADRPKGIILPRKFDASRPMTEIYKAAMETFSDMYDQLVEAREVSLRKKKK